MTMFDIYNVNDEKVWNTVYGTKKSNVFDEKARKIIMY